MASVWVGGGDGRRPLGWILGLSFLLARRGMLHRFITECSSIDHTLKPRVAVSTQYQGVVSMPGPNDPHDPHFQHPPGSNPGFGWALLNAERMAQQQQAIEAATQQVAMAQ